MIDFGLRVLVDVLVVAVVVNGWMGVRAVLQEITQRLALRQLLNLYQLTVFTTALKPLKMYQNTLKYSGQ